MKQIKSDRNTISYHYTGLNWTSRTESKFKIFSQWAFLDT